MKKLIMTAAIVVAQTGALIAQTYQHDFQEILGGEGENLKNYTLCETRHNGFAVASFLPSNGSSDQNRIHLFKTDSDLNVILNQRFKYSSVGLHGFEITPQDIYQTKEGFIIAGGMINEGDPSKSGGFLLHIKDYETSFDFDWMQIYPSENIAGIKRMRSLMRVVEVRDGYMAIGRSSDFLVDGIVLRTDINGNVIWSKHLYDEEYEGNQHSDLNDMVCINDREVAIVGTVNGFPQDDADINVVQINTDGEIIYSNVYEFSGELRDRTYTYLERAAAIEFDEEKRELIIAGTVTKKREGVCVEGEYKNILTFGINLSEGGIVNWSTRHDLGVDLTLSNESIICKDIDFSKEGYGVAGNVKNELFGKYSNYNGFVLRLNNDKNFENLRYYGMSRNDFFNRIYNREGKYVVGGSCIKEATNFVWLVDSYNSIRSTCNEIIAEAESTEHPLVYRRGLNRKVNVKNNETKMEKTRTNYTHNILCDRIIVARGVIAPKIGNVYTQSKTLSRVYPTIIQNDILTIENNSEYINYRIHSLNGNVLSQKGHLKNGINTIEINNLTNGMYVVICSTINEEQELFKIIVK